MDLIVEGTRYSVPEKWIGRWQFLVDYRDFVLEGSDSRARMSIHWSYTGAGEVALWVELNKRMDNIRITRPIVSWNKMIDPTNTTSPLTSIQESYGLLDVSTDNWLISLKSVEKIVSFMNPAVYSYLLCTDIDDGSTVEYHNLGYYTSISSMLVTQTKSGNNHVHTSYGMDRLSSAVGVVLRCRLREVLTYDKPLLIEAMEAIASILKRSSILTLIGMTRLYYSRRLMGNNHKRQFMRDLLQHMERERLTPSIRTALAELTEVSRELARMELLDSGLSTYIDRVTCILLYFQDVYSNSVQLSLLCGMPMTRQLNSTNGLIDNVITHTIFSASVVENLIPVTRNKDRILDMIQRQLDVCHANQLASIAKYLLGLIPVVEGIVVRKLGHIVPFYYEILFENSALIGKTIIYPSICRDLLMKHGERYMRMCADCLLRLIDYHKTTSEKSVGDLFTTYTPTTLPDLNSPLTTSAEDKRLTRFVEAIISALP